MESSGSGIEDNETNMTCYSLERTHPAALVLHAIILAIITVCSLVGNGLILILVARFEQLRTRSVLFSLSMVAADIIFTISNAFPALITTILKYWAFTKMGCIAFGFLASYSLITRWFIVGLLSLDRFCTVFFPFSYKRRCIKWILILLIIAAWVTPFLASVIPAHFFFEFELRETQPNCLPTCMISGTIGRICQLYYTGLVTLTVIIGSLVPICLYTALYCKGKQMQRSAKHTLGRITIQIASGSLVSKPVGEFRSSNRENRATITFLLIFLTVIVTGVPSYISQSVRSFNFSLHCRIPIYVHFIVYNLLLLAPVLNSLVIMKDRDFRSCLTKLFCCRKKTGDIGSYQSHGDGASDRNSSRRHSIQSDLSVSVNHIRPSTSISFSASQPIQECPSDDNSEAEATETMYTIAELCESESSTSV